MLVTKVHFSHDLELRTVVNSNKSSIKNFGDNIGGQLIGSYCRRATLIV